MTRTDTFSKEYAAMTRAAEAAGWCLDGVAKTWRHDRHARQYASLMHLFEEQIQERAE